MREFQSGQRVSEGGFACGGQRHPGIANQCVAASYDRLHGSGRDHHTVVSLVGKQDVGSVSEHDIRHTIFPTEPDEGTQRVHGRTGGVKADRSSDAKGGMLRHGFVPLCRDALLRGYGFVIGGNGGVELFCHKSRSFSRPASCSGLFQSNAHKSERRLTV